MEYQYDTEIERVLKHENKQKLSLTELCCAILQIETLCKLKADLKLRDLSLLTCFVCKNIIDYLVEKGFSQCGHVFHFKCVSEIAIQRCPNLDFENAFIECGFCKQLLKDKEVRNSVPKRYIEIREEQILEQQTMLLRDEEIMQREQEAENKQFTCSICQEEKYLNYEGRTLNCDCQFCGGCLKEYIVTKIKNGEFLEEQIFCPNQCKKEGCFVDPNVIKDLLQYEYQDLYIKMIEFRARNYQRSQNIQLILCPGYFLKSLQTQQQSLMSQKQIEDFRMKTLSIPNGYSIHECPNLLEYDTNLNLKSTKCSFCKYEFCLFGCEKTHDGTCEQFRIWLRENSQADAEFEKLIQQEKMVKCPKCQSIIQKNGGCNHMTCRRPGCGKEFCYVCLANHPCGRH